MAKSCTFMRALLLCGCILVSTAALASAKGGSRRMLQQHTTEVGSVTTLENVVTTDTKQSRSAWLSAYIAAATSGMRSATQQVHQVLRRGKQARMLQEGGTFGAGQQAPVASARPSTYAQPRVQVESVRPAGTSITSTSAEAATLRGTTGTGYAPTTSGAAGTRAHADVIGNPTPVQTPPSQSSLEERSSMAENTDTIAGQYAPGTPNTRGTEARADVIGNPVVVNPPPTRQESGAAFGTP